MTPSAEFRLVDSNWRNELRDALLLDNSALRIVCPFIKRATIEGLLRRASRRELQVITRFSLADFGAGVSDISALRYLLERGARIRGVKHLHAKLFVFGASRAILTSANLTGAALAKNKELGFVADEPAVVERCIEYFANLWDRAEHDLTTSRLKAWERTLEPYLLRGGLASALQNLPDEGVDADLPPDLPIPPASTEDPPQVFVKLFGTSARSNRLDWSTDVLVEVERSGCHWACTYPENRRPRSVEDGALIFMGRMVRSPNDILVYGRARAFGHEPGRDDATREDIRARPWKAKWPHYIRVYGAEFVAGSLSNGVSLYELMDRLREQSFESTLRNAAEGRGNTDPYKAYRQQAAVQLSAAGYRWLNDRFERACSEHGKLAGALLEQLDWPLVPAMAGDRA